MTTTRQDIKEIENIELSYLTLDDYAELKEAMRYAINRDTMKFKSTAELECVFCSSIIKPEADHILEFKNISKAFF